MNTNAKLSKEQVIASLQFFNELELIEINKALVNIGRAKQRSPSGMASQRAIASATAKAQFFKHENVEFTSTKTKQVIKGKIIKICSKNIHVQTPEQVADGQFWVVPPTMLRKA